MTLASLKLQFNLAGRRAGMQRFRIFDPLALAQDCECVPSTPIHNPAIDGHSE
jgi:hypothetical protein